ncbi:MAG: AEC family transporter [Sulfurovum sp.]|nr:AEC family transporter [Sulfurovum sp.]
MASIILLLAFLAAGYLLQRAISNSHSEKLSNILHKFVIYISLPSLVLVYMVDMSFDDNFLLPIASAWGILVVSIVMVLVLSKIFKWTRRITGALLMIIPFGNTSFLGIPFTKVFFGDAGIPYAVIYDQLGSFLMLSTVGIIILSIYSGHRLSVPIILYKLVSFPSTIALVVAFILEAHMIPDLLMLVLKGLASTLTPLALVVIGLHLKLKLDKDKLSPMFIGLSIKLIIAPLLLFFGYLVLDIDGLSAEVSILETAMGPMMSSAMLAIGVGLERRFVASTLGYGIVLSFITLPLIYWISTNFL